MRLHTDTLTERDIHAAIGDLPAIYAETTTFGSRTRDHAIETRLFAFEGGPGRAHVNTGRYGAGHPAATWDEWGVMFARLFAKDKNMLAGWAYSGFDHYHIVTNNRFTPDGIDGEPHARHRWWQRQAPPMTVRGEVITGTWCKCGAARYSLSRYDARFERIFGRTWTERGFTRIEAVA